MIPNLYIMNRLDRNWRNKSPELIQLAKMKNNAEHELIIEKPVKETHICPTVGNVALFLKSAPVELPETSLVTTEQTLEAITVMSYGWLMLGTRMVASSEPVTVGSPQNTRKRMGANREPSVAILLQEDGTGSQAPG